MRYQKHKINYTLDVRILATKKNKNSSTYRKLLSFYLIFTLAVKNKTIENYAQ